MKSIFSTAVLVTTLLTLPQLAAASTQLEALLQPLQAVEVKLSPDGAKIGVLSLEQGKRILTLMTLDPLQVSYVLRFTQGREVGHFHWVNHERIATSVFNRYDPTAPPTVSGDLFAINYNGRRPKTVFGYDVGYDNAVTTSRIPRQEIQTAHAEIISMLPADRSHVLVSTFPWEEKGSYWRHTGKTVGEVLELNVYNGRSREVMTLPARGGRAFADDKGAVHFAAGRNFDGTLNFYRRAGNDWQQVSNPGRDQYAYPVGYSANQETAYLLERFDQERTDLIEMDLADGKTVDIAYHPRLDISGVMLRPGTSEPIAVYLDDGLLTTTFLDPGDKTSAKMAALQKRFEGYRVKLGTSSIDGHRAILVVFGDDKPGDFHLVDFRRQELRLLVSAAGSLSPERLAHTQSFAIQAGDGTRLQGALTPPPGATGKQPMIVITRGESGGREYGMYDRERQILAAAGYLVMSVNSRGSRGYGSPVQATADTVSHRAGAGDIVAATRWAVQEGHADPARVCIYGPNSGLALALAALAQAPDLYQCVAGISGVYDQEMMALHGYEAQKNAGVASLRNGLARKDHMNYRDSNSGMMQGPIAISKGRLDVPATPDLVEELTSSLTDNKGSAPINTSLFLFHAGESLPAVQQLHAPLAGALEKWGITLQQKYLTLGEQGYVAEQSGKELYTGLIAYFRAKLGSG